MISKRTTRPPTNQSLIHQSIFPHPEVIDQELAYRSLYEFTIQYWNTVDTSPFVDNWHLGCICEHVQAVLEGEIKRLLINIPPRHMKSLSTAVFAPGWEWLRHPEAQFLYASYAHALSIRDSVKCRRVITSPKYQELKQYAWDKNKPLRDHLEKWGKDPYPMLADKEIWDLTKDQNAKQRFETTVGGYRLATSVDGGLTGEGGDFIVVDDPHNVKDGESEAKREAALQWWDESMSTRLNDPNKGAFIVVMQRVHERDLSGHILKNENGWDHLCIPARYEGNRIVSSHGWTDPRKEQGELLWPARFTDANIKELERKLGSYATAGQLQQRPAPREGGMFQVDNITILPAAPMQHRIVAVLRYWDKAGTQGGGAYTAGIKMALLDDGQFCVLHVVRGQWSALQREKMVALMAKMDGVAIPIWIEQEPGSGGKESATNTITKTLPGYTCRAERPTGDKVVRANPYSAQVEAGNVCLVKGDWNDAYIEELRNFPKGTYKDQVDASSGAFAQLALAAGGSSGIW